MSDDIGHGMREMLATLDPERSDAGYWHRFHRWVLKAAAPELARRRRQRPMTVSEMVFSWWRALVPIAMATAALAGAVLLSERPNPSPVAYFGRGGDAAQGHGSPGHAGVRDDGARRRDRAGERALLR